MDVIAPAIVPVRFMGNDVPVSPLKVAQVAGVTRALKGVDLSAGMDILTLIADHGEAVIQAVAIAVNLPLAQVEQAEPNEFLNLTSVVIERNTDFFVQVLALQLRVPIIQLLDKLAGAGKTPSKS